MAERRGQTQRRFQTALTVKEALLLLRRFGELGPVIYCGARRTRTYKWGGSFYCGECARKVRTVT